MNVTLTSTLLLSFLIVLLAVAAMAIGVLLGRNGLRGSCGGIGLGGCTLCANRRRRADGSGPDAKAPATRDAGR